MESFLQNRPALATANRYVLQPPTEPGFQPFLRPAGPNEKENPLLSVQVTDEGLVHPGGEPKIELIELDGSVERIVITCSCCKRIELQCEY